ncbi:serine/threonine protein kinase [Paenibacillus yanchengensis]|uniref:Serine/threonine protein kinase n=1 Tax=Paenibacillus yanchengensis TaxID=2035833 RepID=A0ABW4YQH1_9BACL
MNRYECIRKIADGHSSYVLEVSDLQFHRIKRIMKISTDHEYIGQIVNEARLLASLQHDALPIVYDYSYEQSPPLAWIILNVIEGKTLEQWMETELVIDYRLLLQIAEQLTNVISYLHRQPIPIVHRDLKPSNIMMNERGKISVIDFGIAMPLETNQMLDTTFFGTLGFAAPEQYQTNNDEAYTAIDTGVDIYSVGAVLRWLLSFYYKEIGTDSNTAHNLLREKQVHNEFYNIVDELMVNNRQLRIASIDDTYRKLKQLQQRLPSALAQGENDRTNIIQQPYIIVITSLNKSAGATFVAHLLSELLAVDRKVTIIDGGEEVLQSQLAVGNYKLQISHGNGYQPYQLFRASNLSIDYFVKSVNMEDESNRIANYRSIVDELQQQMVISKLMEYRHATVIVDLSYRKQGNLWNYWMDKADHIVVVADPFLSTWSNDRLEIVESMLSQLPKRTISFVANKWSRFGYEHQWLSYFPEAPIVKLPYIDLHKRLQYTWASQWITSDKNMRNMLGKAMKPLIKRLRMEHNTS